MKRAPMNGADAGGRCVSVPLNQLVHAHILTKRDGRYVALLCRRTGRLERLGRSVRA
jgi:hypothetical protein